LIVPTLSSDRGDDNEGGADPAACRSTGDLNDDREGRYDEADGPPLSRR
jgi:hypothetical protein